MKKPPPLLLKSVSSDPFNGALRSSTTVLVASVFLFLAWFEFITVLKGHPPWRASQTADSNIYICFVVKSHLLWQQSPNNKNREWWARSSAAAPSTSLLVLCTTWPSLIELARVLSVLQWHLLRCLNLYGCFKEFILSYLTWSWKSGARRLLNKEFSIKKNKQTNCHREWEKIGGGGPQCWSACLATGISFCSILITKKIKQDWGLWGGSMSKGTDSKPSDLVSHAWDLVLQGKNGFLEIILWLPHALHDMCTHKINAKISVKIITTHLETIITHLEVCRSSKSAYRGVCQPPASHPGRGAFTRDLEHLWAEVAGKAREP